MPFIELDQRYFPENSVKIVVLNCEHQGKYWKHTHGFFEFVYIDKGFSLHSYNGKTTVLTAGDLFAIFPGDIHSYNSVYHTSLYNCLFYLDDLGDLKEEILRLPGIDWNRGGEKNPHLPLIRVSPADRHDLVMLLEQMRWERQNKGIGWELNLKSLLIRFLIMFSRMIQNSAEEVAGDDSRGYCGYIYSALQYVEDHYREDISGKDIAAYAGLSADYLTKQFKAVMAMTPSEYVRKFRVAKAIDLLKTTDRSIADIAAETGFGDISLFSRVFKQIIGIPPVAFRKE